MTKRNSTSINIDFVWVQTQCLYICQYYDTKSFINLKQWNIFFF